MGRRGHKPGEYGEDIRGLKVEYANAVKEVPKHGYGHANGPLRPPGWYVWVKFNRGASYAWEAVIALRFIREVDAKRAASALESAGLDSAKRMKKAGAETVIRTAFEALQW